MRTSDITDLTPAARDETHDSSPAPQTCQQTRPYSNMFITLLIISQVGGEWVQISQQHYRKPYRPTQFSTQDKIFELDETTPKSNRVYVNQTLPDYNWDKNSDIYPKGIITRVQINNEENAAHYGDREKSSVKQVLRNSNVNTNPIAVHENGFVGEEENDAYDFKFARPNIYNENIDRPETTTKLIKHNVNKFQNSQHEFKRPSVIDSGEDVFEDSYHVIPKMGSVKRVQLDSRNVRTPIMKIQTIKSEEKDPTGNEGLYNQHEPKSQVPSNKQDRNKTLRDTANNKDHILVQNNTDIITSYNAYEKGKFNQQSESNGTKTIYSATNDLNSKETLKVNQLTNIRLQEPAFVTKVEEFNDESEAVVSNDPLTDSSELHTGKPSVQPQKGTPENGNNNNNRYESKSNNTMTNLYKVNTMENVLKFMAVVADTIKSHTRRSVGSKIRYLQNLQDTILANIGKFSSIRQR